MGRKASKNSSKSLLESLWVNKLGIGYVYDIVNRYAKERMAQKYRKAVMNVITVLSDTEIRILNLCICSIQIGFRVSKIKLFSGYGIVD